MAFVRGVSAMTNFERITESPEKLAKFIIAIVDCCDQCETRVDCRENGCPLCGVRNCNEFFSMTNWLQEKSDTPKNI